MQCRSSHALLKHIGPHWGEGGGRGRLSKIKIVIKRTRIEDDENTCNLEAG